LTDLALQRAKSAPKGQKFTQLLVDINNTHTSYIHAFCGTGSTRGRVYFQGHSHTNNMLIPLTPINAQKVPFWSKISKNYFPEIAHLKYM
jgi:hypothetical protein